MKPSYISKAHDLRVSKASKLMSAPLLPYLRSVGLCALFLFPSLALTAPSASCKMKKVVESLVELRTDEQAAINATELRAAAVDIKNGVLDLAPEHRTRVSTVITRFADYLERAPGATSTSVYDGYTDALLGILESTANPTTDPSGQNAVRTMNAVGGLFHLIPQTELDNAVDNFVWKRPRYDTPSRAFAQNGLRVELVAARNEETLVNTKQPAFAGAVRYNSPTDVVFSGLYTNHPTVAGMKSLPQGATFWRKESGPRFTITDSSAYATWLETNFYSNGAAAPVNPQTLASYDATLTDILRPAIKQRMQLKLAGTYNNVNTGLPGTHAEFQAANSLADGLSSADTTAPVIGIHTVRASGGLFCTGFECCAGCTAGLKGFARSTGGGGILKKGEGMRRLIVSSFQNGVVDDSNPERIAAESQSNEASEPGTASGSLDLSCGENG